MKKLLFFSELSGGHLQLSIAIANLIQRIYKDQYEIWFLVNNEYKEIVGKRVDNCKFLVYKHPNSTEESAAELQQHIIEWFAEWGKTWNEKDRVKFVHNGGHTYLESFEDSVLLHDQITELIKGLKPDLILVDSLLTIPTGINLNIPYVLILSAAPTFIGHHQLPPPRAGLDGEYTEENIRKWNQFIKDAYHHPDFLKFMEEANNFLKEQNAPVNFDGRYMYYAPSPYLNIYNYPKELDYVNDVVKMPGNWVRIDSAVLDTPSPFEIPDKLKDLEGKLIYFSLGSMASCYKPLMNRLLKIFSEMPHRFIVSTGLIGDQYEPLYPNQYGEKFLNQLAVLQTVDIYITHGGNNSVTESAHFGVPMIVIPLFADQCDNAKRIVEKNCGVQLDAFNSTKDEFMNAIEVCSTDQMKDRMKKMSDRIKENNNLRGACESIVDLIK